ncbi:putative diguanylate cyclase YcdT [Clostridium homopropionicum DSM 5847]|uniref:Putative diguanylate cyclase YcdT n=1 Tax=Clostridium homopropionicum DSM 5847 TaxID=1121318 RepID=A0A0L6ZCX1_9CLOT|nr:sensor domain-containing diguanylate cyclase [Clostridium homopropionicum]KOA20792.1 putative diguanylate cyclase YcdT [Clostridium homopropionicum DSM 5847]SFF89044.1 diguanylate cyclase with GAF sensor [Clostridium homopropionicum]
MNINNTDLDDQYKRDYLKLKDEFETYQSFAESTIQLLTEKNIRLEKKLDSITNIVEISKYINSYLSKKELIPMINDMIIGILGATYCSIYLIEDDELTLKASNLRNQSSDLSHKELFKECFNGKPFIINSKEPIFDRNYNKSDIHSLIGVPIYLREKFIGYIIVEHALNNFFVHEHIKFISTIANQIAIALENNNLYNQIRENSIRDPLLGIYNRKYFYDVVEDKLAKDNTRKFAIIMMDLDNFKKANDLYGHQYGDEVLKLTVKTIEENIDKNDMLARYGGEEMVIFIEGFHSISEVFDKIDKIRNKIKNTVVSYKEIQGSITASFGISYYPEDGKNLNEIISVADYRLYVAKKSGKNKVVNH